MNVRVEGQTVEAACGETAENVLRKALSGKKIKAAIAANALCGGRVCLLDLSASLPAGCTELSPVYADSPDALGLIRHSAAHVMAAAVKRLFPDAKVAIGPAIENGFYYDFDAGHHFSDEDFPAIEEEMRGLIEARLPFVRENVTKKEALRRFHAAGERYKMEIVEGIEADEVSLYTCGDFTDLCRGPHIPHTGFAAAVKLLSVAGAYWRGDEKNRMLSRIYGAAFADGKALAAWLRQQEEARRRDHRKLGRELEFFTFQEDVA
ncbi:MAG: threonine--tRNA ligase, partial [Desulfovibrio sp.]|nr:threonine--tRNA ligase [Desulfovibrio sp.]